MAKFTTRVELHDSEDVDYDDLHDAMERRGFERTIEINGVRYQLPDAEYTISGDFTQKAVCQKARDACDEISKDAGILVTKSGGRHSSGLKRAKS